MRKTQVDVMRKTQLGVAGCWVLGVGLVVLWWWCSGVVVLCCCGVVVVGCGGVASGLAASRNPVHLVLLLDRNLVTCASGLVASRESCVSGLVAREESGIWACC